MKAARGSLAQKAGVLVAALAYLLPAISTHAGVLYQLDNGASSGGLNASDGSETRDNWFGNVFTIQAGGEIITSVVFNAYGLYPSMTASKLVIYRDTDGDGNPTSGAVRVCTQNFNPTSSGWFDIALSTPLTFSVGDKIVVAVFIPSVPGDQFPYNQDNNGASAAGSFWARTDPGLFNLDDLSGARQLDQALPDLPFGWKPGPNHLMLRANGGPLVIAPVTIANLPATNVLGTSAYLNGELTSTGSAPTFVWVNWDTTDKTTNKTWATSDGFGGASQPTGRLSYGATGLATNSVYYYTYYASNAVTEAWASPSIRFKTMGVPVVNNGPGATPVGANWATLNGNLTNGGVAIVSFLWGMSAGSLTNTLSVGTRSEGAFSAPLTGLAPGTYYYGAYATNDYGQAQASASSFMISSDPTWTAAGSPDNTNWSNNANWSYPPVSGTNVVFASDGALANIDDADKTVGTVVFNRPGGFTINSSAGKALTLNSGISVPVSDTYTIEANVYGTPTIDVAGGGNVKTRSTRLSGFVKTGAGEYGIKIPNFTWGYNEGAATIRAGTVNMWKNNYNYGSYFSALNVSNGAKLVSTDNAGGAIYGNGQSLILGNLGDAANKIGGFAFGDEFNTPTVLFAGTEGKATTVNRGGMTVNHGLVVLSNNTDNVNGRLYTNCYINLQGGKLQLLGNDAADSIEDFVDLVGVGNFYGLPKIEVLHGSGANATVAFHQSYWNGASLASGGTALRVLGNDVGAASAPRSVVKLGPFGGNAWPWWVNATNALPYISLGTNEFAVHDPVTRGVHALEGSRPNLLVGTTVNDDVLINNPQTLIADCGAASIKIDGANPINLNGRTLTLGNMDFGGGLLQTGANNTGGIWNGTIQVSTNPGAPIDRFLYVQGDKDLTLSATVNAAGITKMGTGKVTLNGPLNLSYNDPGNNKFPIHWLEGTLELDIAPNITLSGYGVGVEPDACLIKRGTNTITIAGVNNSTGGITIVGGTIVAGRPGWGPITIRDGATFYETGGVYPYWETPRFILDGGMLRIGANWDTDLSPSVVLEVPAGKTGTLGLDLNRDINLYTLEGLGTLRVVSFGGARNVSFHDVSRSFMGTLRAGSQCTFNIQSWYESGSYWPTNPAAGGYFAESGGKVVANTPTINGLSYGGFGTFQSAGTWTSAGGAWTPGDTNSAGVLTVSGNLALTTFGGSASLPLANAWASFSQGGWSVAGLIDGTPATGWAINGGIADQTATVQTIPGQEPGTGLLTFKLRHDAYQGEHRLGKFRISVTTDPRGSFANWTQLAPVAVGSGLGSIMQINPDNTIVAYGPNPDYEYYVVTATNPLTGVTGFRLEVLTDPLGNVATNSGGYGWQTTGPGRSPGSGNFVVSEFQVFAGGVPPTFSTLYVDLKGTNTTPGAGCDELAVTGTLSGLGSSAVASSVDLVVRTDTKLKGLGGKTYTIVTSTSDFTGKQFHNVTWQTPGASGTVNYNNGSITLSGVRAGYTMEGTSFIMR